MPYCGFLANAWTTALDGQPGLTVHFWSPCDPEEIQVVDIIRRAFPGASVGDLDVSYDYDFEEFSPRYEGQIAVGEGVNAEELEVLLGLLQDHITVVDQCDECHALAMHSLPDPDPESSQFHRTKIGDLVNRAKPYSPWSGDLNEARRLAAHLEEFIVGHPAYARASWLLTAPPSNKAKMFDLPSVLGRTIAMDLELNLGKCVPTREVKPQKDIESIEELRQNRHNSLRIDDAIDSATVIILDDIYRSGQTMGDIARAAREAGAAEVLGLAATKTMKFAQGLSL